MTNEYFESIWEVNIVPLKTVAAIKRDAEIPSPINALGLEKRDFIKFEIPIYQRGLVWTKAKRADFLKSIRKGWPTGAIVLTRLEQVQGMAGPLITWHVLDGQQRISTFQHFRENFWKAPWYEFTAEMKIHLQSWADIVSSVENAPKVTLDDLISGIEMFTRGDESHVFTENYLEETSSFLNRLSSIGGFYVPAQNDFTSTKYEELEANVRFIRTALSAQKNDLDDVPVTLITVTPKQGTTTNDARTTSAEIFVKLNSGISLTRYELLNARWIGTNVDWADFEVEKQPYVKEFMLDKMQERIKAAWELDGDLEYDPAIEELNESEITLFDFLYAVSIATRNKPYKKAKDGIIFEIRPAYPSGKSEKEVAFDVASLVFIGSSDSSAVEKLPDYFPIEANTVPKINEFAKYYFEAVEVINKNLDSTRHVTQGKQKAQLGAIQASTYIASYITGVYHVSFGRKEALSIDVRKGESSRTHDGNQSLTSIERAKMFQKTLKSWFLHDSLDAVFQGNLANSESKNRVWIEYKQGKSSEYFLQQPSLATLLDKMRNLFLNEFVVPQAPLRRNYVNSTLALFLTVYQDLGKQLESFTIDHVIPWRKIREKPFVSLNLPIPLNHPANFMPLEKRINSSRQNTPWADFYSKVEIKDRDNVREALFIEPEFITHEVRENLTDFATFLLRRWTHFVDRALTNVELEEYLEFSEQVRKEKIIDHLTDIAKGLEQHGVFVKLNDLEEYVKSEKLRNT